MKLEPLFLKETNVPVLSAAQRLMCFSSGWNKTEMYMTVQKWLLFWDFHVIDCLLPSNVFTQDR